MAFALFATGAICAADVPVVMHSALITDVTINANDSPLVRAAKLVALTRSQMTVHSSRVIDNDSLRQLGSSHFSVATNEPAALPPMTTLGPSNPPATSPYQRQQQAPPVVPTTINVPQSPFQLTPPPPPSSPTPYRPQ